MSTISASSEFDATNPIAYAQAMGNIVDSMQQNTLTQVGNVLSGLPSIQTLSQGAYGFEQSVASNSQAALTQTLFGTPGASQAGLASANPQSVGIEGMLMNETNQLTPILQNIGTMAAANQSAAIQSQSALAQSAVSSSGGGGKK